MCHELGKNRSVQKQQVSTMHNSSWIAELVVPHPRSSRMCLSVPCHLCHHQQQNFLVHLPHAWHCARGDHDALLSLSWWRLSIRGRCIQITAEKREKCPRREGLASSEVGAWWAIPREEEWGSAEFERARGEKEDSSAFFRQCENVRLWDAEDIGEGGVMG